MDLKKLKFKLLLMIILLFVQSCSSLRVYLYQKGEQISEKENTLVVFYIYHNYLEPLKFIVEYSLDKKEENFRILEEMSKEIPPQNDTINYFICKVKNKKDFYLRLAKFLGDGFQGELPTIFQKIKYGDINFLGTYNIIFDINSFQYTVVRKEDKKKLKNVLLKIIQDFHGTKFEKMAFNKLKVIEN